MRGKLFLIVPVLGAATILSAVVLLIRSATAQEVKLDKNQITPALKVFPKVIHPPRS